jgi:hypothetical protein
MSMLGVLLLSARLDGEGPPERGEVRVARLIRELAHPNYAQRQAADRELAGMGDPTRAALQAALADEDLEVRLRAKRLLDRLDLEALWAGSRITVSARDEPAAKVLTAIAA